MRGLTILEVDCAYAPANPVEEIMTKAIAVVTVINNFCRVITE
jgi:hypothetical protein